MKLTRKTTLIIVSIVFVIALASLIYIYQSGAEKRFLKENGLADLSLKEKISYLETTIDEPNDFNAGIDGKTFRIGDATHNYTYDLPENEFYLSMAPYINNTHPCANHNLVTCRGELANETIHILAVNAATNEVLIDGDYTSGDNGFFGVWLQKGIENVNITVTYNGMTAQETVSTYETSNTCLTTLPLSN